MTGVDVEVTINGDDRCLSYGQVKSVNAGAVVSVVITIGVVTAQGVVSFVPGVAVALADCLGIVSSVVDGKVERHDAVATVGGDEGVTIDSAFGVGGASEGVGFASRLCHIVLDGRAVDGDCDAGLVIAYIEVNPIVGFIYMIYTIAEIEDIVVFVTHSAKFVHGGEGVS